MIASTPTQALAILAFSAGLAAAAAPATAACLVPAGDVTGDGATNTADVNCAILTAIAGKSGAEAPACTAGDSSRADIDCNGAMAIVDIQLIVWRIFFQVEPWPTGFDGDDDGCIDGCEPGLPGVPEDFTVTPGVASITLSWDPPLEDGGSPITEYSTSCYTTTESYSQTVLGSPVTFFGLTPGVAYKCVVGATNGIGDGPTAKIEDIVPLESGDPFWIPAGDYLLDKGNQPWWNGFDCAHNHFGTAVVSVGGVQFDVGVWPSGPQMTGLIAGGVTIPAPNGFSTCEHVWMIFPGGRCSSQPLQVTFHYIDGTQAALDQVTIPYGCTPQAQITAPFVQIDNQGNYVGACCTAWYRGRFDNPDPSKLIESIEVDYTDSCGGAFTGQIWALTLTP